MPREQASKQADTWLKPDVVRPEACFTLRALNCQRTKTPQKTESVLAMLIVSLISDYYACDEWMEITGSHGLILVTRCSGKLRPAVPPLILLDSDGERPQFVTRRRGGELRARRARRRSRNSSPPFFRERIGRRLRSIGVAASKWWLPSRSGGCGVEVARFAR